MILVCCWCVVSTLVGMLVGLFDRLFVGFVPCLVTCPLVMLMACADVRHCRISTRIISTKSKQYWFYFQTQSYETVSLHLCIQFDSI